MRELTEQEHNKLTQLAIAAEKLANVAVKLLFETVELRRQLQEEKHQSGPQPVPSR